MGLEIRYLRKDCNSIWIKIRLSFNILIIFLKNRKMENSNSLNVRKLYQPKAKRDPAGCTRLLLDKIRKMFH